MSLRFKLLFCPLFILIMGSNLLYFVVWFSKPTLKKAIFAGYASGSMLDYRFEVYEDSTYWLSCLDEAIKDNRWTRQQDSLFLWHNNHIGATFYENKLVTRYSKELKCLELMRFRSFSPAKVVDYPK